MIKLPVANFTENKEELIEIEELVKKEGASWVWGHTKNCLETNKIDLGCALAIYAGLITGTIRYD